MVEDLVRRLGEPAVALLIALETLLPPIPSEAVLPFAGFQSARGLMHPVLAWVAAMAGSLTGAWLLYALGVGFGRDRLFALAGRRWFVAVSPADLERGERFFARHGGAVVLFGRCVPLVRSVVSIPAGIERMPLGRFTLCTAVGSAVWNAAFITAGWHLERRWELVEQWLEPVGIAVLALAAAALVATATRKVRQSPVPAGGGEGGI